MEEIGDCASNNLKNVNDVGWRKDIFQNTEDQGRINAVEWTTLISVVSQQVVRRYLAWERPF